MEDASYFTVFSSDAGIEFTCLISTECIFSEPSLSESGELPLPEFDSDFDPDVTEFFTLKPSFSVF